MSSKYQLPFDPVFALTFARAIDALYTGTLKPNVPDGGTDTQVFVGEHAGRFVILFPGTASWADLFTDLRIRKTEWFDDAMTHTGFTTAFQSVWGDILSRLRASNNPSVFIAGHSLGGALATLCAEACKDAGIAVLGVYTFGSPRVGNGVFADDYDAELREVTFRLWNLGDPVPCGPLPLPTFRSGIYTHCGTEIYLKENGGIVVDPCWLRHLAEIILAWRDPLTALASLDHPIRSYVRKLEAITRP